MTVSKIRKYIKSFFEEVESIVGYLLFRDMGNLGEGCLVSLFIWGLIIIFVILIATA